MYLLTFICRYPLNWKQFQFSGYLWKIISKQIIGHVRVFSSRDKFLVSAVVVPFSILTSMLYANYLAQMISEINREY